MWNGKVLYTEKATAGRTYVVCDLSVLDAEALAELSMQYTEAELKNAYWQDETGNRVGETLVPDGQRNVAPLYCGNKIKKRTEVFSMEIEKLYPECKDNLWGGMKLVEKYGKQTEKRPCAESWEISYHPNGKTRLANGKTLEETASAAELGANATGVRSIPQCW